MDLFKKAQGMMGGQGSNQHVGQQPGQPAGQKQDIGDKIFGGVMKKAGQKEDHARDEKITDSMRGMYEKATGKKVNAKFSN